MQTIKIVINLSVLSIKISLYLLSVNDSKVTVFPIQVIKYTLHLKVTSDLFANVNLNQYRHISL
jgi:hypothetical protein